jgi:hypothetical protein
MELFSILRRRWILFSVLLAMTFIGSGVAFVKLPSTYQAESAIVFLASQNVSKGYGGNPYMAFNSTLNLTADVVRYETNDLRTAKSLAAQGYTSSYLVTDATDTAGPVLITTVTGHDKAQVEHTLQGVTAEISTKLHAVQSGISAPNRIRDLVITFAPSPSKLLSKKLRSLSIYAGGGVVATFGIPIIIDAILMRRASSVGGRKRRGDESGRGSGPGGDNRPQTEHAVASSPDRDPEWWREPSPRAHFASRDAVASRVRGSGQPGSDPRRSRP